LNGTSMIRTVPVVYDRDWILNSKLPLYDMDNVVHVGITHRHLRPLIAKKNITPPSQHCLGT